METITMTLYFTSQGQRCAATLFRPDAGSPPYPCVVLGHGFTGTRDQLERYATAFAHARIAALTFDYRHFGDSEGQPRQVVDIARQLADWRAAISYARSLDEVDPARVALWGTSLSGGHVITLAAEDSDIAAVVAQVPALDKSNRGLLHEARAKMRREGISATALLRATLSTLAAGVYDAVRGRLGLPPFLIPVFAPPGRVAAFTGPTSTTHLAWFTQAGPTWRNEFAPRFLFHTPRYRAGLAEHVLAPLLVCVAEQDVDTDPDLARTVARQAPRGELRCYPVDHFGIYDPATTQPVLQDQIEFLTKHLQPA